MNGENCTRTSKDFILNKISFVMRWALIARIWPCPLASLQRFFFWSIFPHYFWHPVVHSSYMLQPIEFVLQFLVNWFYFQLFQNFFITFVGRMYTAVLLINFISISFLFFFLRVQNSLPYRRMGTATALYTFILEDFWTKVGLKFIFRIPSI